jgi:hypothetical protein
VIPILQDTVHAKELFWVDHGTSARCFTVDFSAGFLGLGRPTALALLPSSLQLPEVFRHSLGDLLPTFPSKFDSGGIFFLRQDSEGLALLS